MILVWAVAVTPRAALAQAPVVEPAPVDAAAMGVSLSRIARRLQAESDARTGGSSPLNLEFHVDVYGSAPMLQFFATEDLVFGAVPGSAPTHRDMIRHVTPQAFRSPRVDVLSLVAGAAMYGAKRVQDWNYDRQYEAYRKLVEAGRNVPAPKPRP